MIAVILAGGFATRLLSMGKESAKALLPVEGRPVLDYILEKLNKLDEVKRTIITTNMKFEPQFREWFEHKPCKNVEVRVEPSLNEQQKPGAIRALFQLVPDLAGNDVVIIAGDNFFTDNLKGMLEYYKHSNAPVIAVYDVEKLELAKQFSTVETDDDGMIVSFEEKPENPKSTLIGTCIYILSPESLSKIREYLKDGHNPDSPGHFIQWLSKNQPVYGYILTGYWCDIGTPNTYKIMKETISSDSFRLIFERTLK